jgi:hypothetical protein
MLARTCFTCLATLALCGCAVNPYGHDENFGASVKSAQALQLARPGVRPVGSALALDGESAALAIDNYYSSFAKPPPPVNVFNIGVGSNSSGSSSPR